jgi:hypothetical protein
MVQPVDVATSKRYALPSQPQMAAVAGDKQGTAVIKHHHRSFPLSAQRVGDTTSLPMVGMDLDLHPNNVQARPQSPDKTESLSPPSPAPAQNIPAVSTERLIPFAQPSTKLPDSHHRHHRASQQISTAASPVRPQPALSSPQSPTKTQLLDLDTSADPPPSPNHFKSAGLVSSLIRRPRPTDHAGPVSRRALSACCPGHVALVGHANG